MVYTGWRQLPNSTGSKTKITVAEKPVTSAVGGVPPSTGMLCQNAMPVTADRASAPVFVARK